MNTSTRTRHGVIALLLGAMLCACTDPEPAPPPPPPPLSEAALEEAMYITEWTDTGVVQLENGEYREPSADATSSPLVITLSPIRAFGDLNDDGLLDAAVVLVTDPGGSGTFFDLAVVLNHNGQPDNAAIASLGDRTEIKSLAIEDGHIVVEMITHGPDDPLCCPTQEVTQHYVLEGEELVPVSAPVDS